MLSVPYEVKKALRSGRYKKNYKFNIYSDNTFQFTIDNDNLVAESVKIDERMCSGSDIKFGLCEGSSLEFQYFGFDNIRGCEIRAVLSVEYDNNGSSAYYDIPMGRFTVDQCPKQYSTGIYKVIAYNKLKSEYLDAKVNQTLQEYFAHESNVYLVDIIDDLLDGYGITHYDTEEISPSTQDDTWGMTGTGGVSGYTYDSLYGDQGAFAPWFLKDQANITTSSTIYLTASGYYREYIVSPTYDGRAIRVDTDINFDTVDWSITNCIKYEIAKINTSTSDNTIWNKIYNRSVNLSNGVTLPAWGLQVCIVFKDNTKKVYSWSLFQEGKADGTFTDLNRLTFFDVSKIIFFQPAEVMYMYPNNTIYVTISGYTNAMRCYGEDGDYYYKPNSSADEVSAKYTTPIMPDRHKIPHWTDDNALTAYINVKAISNMAPIETLSLDINAIPDVTLRELQSAVYETICQYGQLDRETDLFSGVELNGGGLYPSTTLYPGTSLYPNTNITNGDNLHPFPSEYKKLWTDTVGEQSFRYLIITYKGLDENNQEKEFKLQRTVNADGTTDYNMSDNWLFKNLVWTEEDVGDYADAMVTKMQDVRWFPFEMWAAGLPYVETGDAIEITDKEGDTYVSYILQRQLNGIQNLQDTYINGELDIF